jgi:purine-cytosine permease-like protein
MVGTLGYFLSLRDASLVIIFFSLIAYIPPAFMGTLGPGTGLRQMIQARYVFGYALPPILTFVSDNSDYMLWGYCCF